MIVDNRTRLTGLLGSSRIFLSGDVTGYIQYIFRMGLVVMGITMDDLARISGFSKATISRALNDDPRVKDETRRMIKELAEQYNYHPHSVASSLAKQQSRIVGLVFPESPRSISDPFFLEFLKGVSETLSLTGYSLLIPPVEQEGLTGALKRLIFQHRADGIILTEPKIKDHRIELLREHNIPFVFLGSTVDKDVFWVDGDNRGGAYQATRYLLDLGHQRVGILLGDEKLVSSRKRYQGYQEALKERGIVVREEWKLQGDFTFEGAYRLIKGMLRERAMPKLTAIFASNDLMAIGAMRAFKEEGWRIPEDISLVGFDGIQLGRYMDPPLTTVQQPIYILGKKVSRKLITMLKKEEVAEQQTLVPLELVIRRSAKQLD